VDSIADEEMANFVVRTHRKEPQSSGDISHDFLKKYILYDVLNVNSVLSDIDKKKLTQLYSEIRNESYGKGSVPITIRTFGSIIRLSESHAKLHLRPTVFQNDANFAISHPLFLEVLFQPKRILQNVILRRSL
jgi:DNA replication licensing factor MCM2